MKTVAGNAITRTSANRHGLAIANQRGRSTATRLARAFASRRETETAPRSSIRSDVSPRLPRDVSNEFSLWPSHRALTWFYAPNMEAPATGKAEVIRHR